MIGYLVVLFLMLPFLDLYLLIELSGVIGIVNTVAIVLATGIIGAALVRKEGRGLLLKLQNSVTAKEVSRNLLEGVFLALGGLLLMSPGIITDLIGLLFVLRPTRERLMIYTASRLKKKSSMELQVYEL